VCKQLICGSIADTQSFDSALEMINAWCRSHIQDDRLSAVTFSDCIVNDDG